MRYLALLLCLMPIFPAWSIWDSGPHDAGLLYLKIENCGRFGYENQGIWPRGSGEHYIFGAGIWVGGLKETTDSTFLTIGISELDSIIFVGSTQLFDSLGVIKIEDELIHYGAKDDTSLFACIRGFAGTEPVNHSPGNPVREMIAYVTVGYNPSDASTEFVPGDLPNEPGYTDTLDRIYFSDDPADTALWPLRDDLGNPIVISNQDSYCIFNDEDSTHHFAPGAPLGIKIVQIGYSWYFQIWEDFIFLTYLVVNHSPDTLHHMYLAPCCDPDIGDYRDDLVGFDSLRNLGYAYDSDFDEPGWGRTPGYIGYDFLESPLGPGGAQLGLTAFKILRNPGVPGPGIPDPDNDDQAYQLMAGYDYQTGEYQPFDSIVDPTDVRFLQCTGPFDLSPGETTRVVIAVIAGADLQDLQANSDNGQSLYDIDFATHDVELFSPSGGEELDSTVLITWEATSVTGNPLKVDIFYSRDGGANWSTVDTALPNTGEYEWNTFLVPDGTRYKISLFAYDQITLGADQSDTTFTINNPGNGLPDVIFISPQSGTVTGSYEIRWWADDADHDSLSIDLYCSRNEVDWEPISLGELNDGSYTWSSVLFHNGTYRLKVAANDPDTFSMDLSEGWVEVVNDHPQAASVTHISGGCNSLSIQVLEYIPEDLNGHQYEIRFRGIRSDGVNPLYSYDFYDITTDSLIVEAQPLSTKLDGNLYTDYSPIIDGFALQFDSQIDGNSFRFIEFEELVNLSGFDGELEIHGEDTLGTAPPPYPRRWAFRGSDYELRWIPYPGDSSYVTLEVYDMTNDCLVEYDATMGDNWYIGSGSEVLDPENDRSLYLCGTLFWFNKDGMMTVPPGPGDVWIVRSAGARVPCDGNVYRFTTVGLEEIEKRGGPPFTFYQVRPNPFQREAVICYSTKKNGKVTIKVYDSSGRLVRTLLEETQPPGLHSVVWCGVDDNQRKIASGVYFIRVGVREEWKSRKIVYIR